MHKKYTLKTIVLVCALLTTHVINTSEQTVPRVEQQKTHKDTIRLKCPECSYKAKRYANVKRHIQSNHKTIDLIYRCRAQRGKAPRATCFSFFTDSNEYTKHTETTGHMSTEITSFQHPQKKVKPNKVTKCPYCPFVSKYKSNVFIHLENYNKTHGSYVYECLCHHIVFTTKDALKQHMAENPNQTTYLKCKKAYHCAECNTFLPDLKSLFKHREKKSHNSWTIKTIPQTEKIYSVKSRK